MFAEKIKPDRSIEYLQSINHEQDTDKQLAGSVFSVPAVKRGLPQFKCLAHQMHNDSRDKIPMRPHILIAFTILSVFLMKPCEAAIRIENDLGGPLGNYILRYSNVGQSGERVIIDGRCYSACTTVIGLVPPKSICVTPRAKLGFHAALIRNHWGRLIVDPDATPLMFNMFPRPIRDWIAFNGGLNARMIYIGSRYLAKLYAWCR